MKTSILKDTFWEISKAFGRFISIFMIVAIGTGFFTGLKATAPDMKHTADAYYDATNLMDIRVLSTLGLSEDDIDAIAATEGINAAYGAYFCDVVSVIGGSTEYVLRVDSLPDEGLVDNNPYFMNRPQLTSGRYPEKSGECVLEYSKNLDLGLEIGDTLVVSSGNSTDLSEMLATDSYIIVGFAISPYYLTYDRESSDIGNGSVNLFMMVPETDFTYPVYTQALITLEGASELDCYSRAYEKLVSGVVSRLENIGYDRCDIRLDDVKAMAYQELDRRRQELAEAQSDYDTQIGDAEKQLSDANAQISEGRATLETERKNYAEQIAQAEAQIRDGEADLAQGRLEYATAVEEYNSMMNEYNDELTALDSIAENAGALQSQADSAFGSINNILNGDTSNLTEEQLQSLLDAQSAMGSMQEGTSGILGYATDMDMSVKNQLYRAQQQLKDAKTKLDAAEAKLAASKAELAQKKREATTQFAEAEKELGEAEAKYNASYAEYEQQKAEGGAKLDEANEKIIRAEQQIESIATPAWYVLDRNKLYSYADYASTAERMDAIAEIFPVFFFLVAALVCLTTMTRMVDEQRGFIGTYKALGYGNGAIASKYVLYAAIASVLGGLLGVNIGIRTLPEVIFSAWKMMYAIPDYQHVGQLGLMLLSVAMGVAVTTVSSYLACQQELRETPALLMRPKPPKSGKKVFLENVRWFWGRLSFSQKVTLRNIVRYKKRFFMTIIGIAGCAALLVAGIGMHDTISRIVDNQYHQIFAFNMNLRFVATAEDEQKQEIYDRLGQSADVMSFATSTIMNTTVYKDSAGYEGTAATLIVPDDTASFTQYIVLRDRVSGNGFDLPASGVVIGEKLAKELRVSVGDTLIVDNGDGITKNVEVAAITEHYVFHYMYMSPEYYKELFRVHTAGNAMLIKLNDANADLERALGTELIAEDAVASVEFYSTISDKFSDTVTSLNAVIVAIIACAALLAFVVVYNLTNINISERIREIATLKVLGFYNREVSSYVFRENVLLTIIGALIGLVIGIGLHNVVITSLEQSGIMYGTYINPLTFLYAFAITLLFSLLVNLLMAGKLRAIKMVESLKSVE